MSPETIGLIGIAAMLLLFFLRIPIAFSFFAVGFFGVWGVKGLVPALNILGSSPFQTMQQSGWTVIPLFVFMGFLVEYCGFATEFFIGVKRWIGHWRGGLLYSIILANAAFGACCGSTNAAVVTFSSIALPETRKYNYSEKITLGCIATSSVLSSLIPPSLAFVTYAIITQNSVLDLFMAGILPGLLLAVFFCIVAFLWTRKDPSLAPATERATMKERLRGTPMMASIALLFIVIIGGLYLGIFTPSEAGGVGAFVVFVMGLLRRSITWPKFKSSIIETAKVTGMIGMLIVGANIFNVFLSITGVPTSAANFITGITESSTGIMLIILVIYLIAGCFLDITATVVLTLPIFYPLIVSAGWDPIQFGVMIVFVIIIGGVSPPFGITAFVLSGATGVPTAQIFRGTIPFLMALIATIICVFIFPQLSLFLPYGVA